MTYNEICTYHAKLRKEHYTGRVSFDYFQGHPSSKVKKEVVENIGEHYEEKEKDS